jgi:peptide-methionine (R)-S-oxide reductase
MTNCMTTKNSAHKGRERESPTAMGFIFPGFCKPRAKTNNCYFQRFNLAADERGWTQMIFRYFAQKPIGCGYPIPKTICVHPRSSAAKFLPKWPNFHRWELLGNWGVIEGMISTQNRDNILKLAAGAIALVGVSATLATSPGNKAADAAPGQTKVAKEKKHPVQKTDAEWKALLTSDQYHVLREEGTEYAGTGELLNEHGQGTFVCAGCGQKLFASSTKFESGTGWPSFYQPLKKAVDEYPDSDGSGRIEVECARCGGHLGHVFEDGPKPTGLRYCMNSVAMKFEKAK